MTTDGVPIDKPQLLHGRDAESARLAEIFGQADRGEGGVIVVRGDAGFGKTALLDAASERAVATGNSVYRGAVTEFERDQPFGLWLDVLREAERLQEGPANGLDEMAGASSASATHGELRYVIERRIIEFLEDEAADGPVAVLLDDVQWADSSSVHVISRLARRVSSMSIALIVARRPLPRDSALDRVEELQGVDVLTLGPLSADDLTSIASDVLDGRPDQALLSALEDVGGSPFMALLLAESASHLQGEALGGSMDDTIGRFLEAVTSETLEMLRSASILGVRFDLDDLGIISESAPMRLLPRLEESIDAGLLRADGDRFEFRHELIWRSLYLAVPEPIRNSLHRELAHRLAATDASSDRVVAHLVIGAREGRDDDLELLQRSAERIAARDPVTAAGLYERALELADDGSERQSSLANGLVSALLWSGQFYRARIRARALLEAPLDPSVRGDVRRALARILVYQGKVDASLAEVERGLADDATPDALRARLLADAALRRLVCDDPQGAAAAGGESLALAERTRDDLAATLAGCALSRIAGYEGHVDEAVDLAMRARVRADASASEAIELLQPKLYMGLALIDADRTAEARSILAEGRDLAEQVGSVWIIPLFHLALSLEAYVSGDWDRTVTEAETSVAAADELNALVFVPWAHALLALIAVARGQSAGVHLKAIEAHVRENGRSQYGDAWSTWAEMRSQISAGRFDLALETGLAAWQRVDGVTSAGDRRIIGADLVRLLIAEGRVAEAEPIARVLDVVARRSSTVADAGMAGHVRGLLAGDASAVLGAADQLGESGRIECRARALEDAAGLLRREGRQEEALAAATQASEAFERLGATSDLARIDALLRSLGIKRGVRRPRKRDRMGWGSVTETESQVLRLVAEGMTNRQIAERMFISPRTVETHIAHLFAKLEASSRAELAVIQVQHGAGDP